MNMNNIIMMSSAGSDWLKMKKLKKLNIVVGSCCSKNKFFLVFTTSRFPYVILCPNFMMVQTSKVKVPNTYKELIRRFVTFEYEKLLLSKSSQNKVASNIAITGKKKKKWDI